MLELEKSMMHKKLVTEYRGPLPMIMTNNSYFCVTLYTVGKAI